jgi:hypothetical protein
MSSIGITATVKFRAKQLCASRHFFSPHSCKIRNFVDRLAFIAAAQRANRNGRTILSCPGERASAQKFRIVRMRNKRHDSLLLKA